VHAERGKATKTALAAKAKAAARDRRTHRPFTATPAAANPAPASLSSSNQQGQLGGNPAGVTTQGVNK